jgi:hypothetical protein
MITEFTAGVFTASLVSEYVKWSLQVNGHQIGLIDVDGPLLQLMESPPSLELYMLQDIISLMKTIKDQYKTIAP